MLSVNHRIINRGFSYGIYFFCVEYTSSYSVYVREVNLKNVSISHLIKMIRHFVSLSVKNVRLNISTYNIYIFSMQSEFLSFFSNAKYVFLFLCNWIYSFFFQMKLDHIHYISLVRCVYIYTLYMCIVHLRPNCLIFSRYIQTYLYVYFVCTLIEYYQIIKSRFSVIVS